MARLHVIANWIQGSGMSGGDRILIELIKRWESKLDISLFISEDGWGISEREGLGKVKHRILVSAKYRKYGYLVDYFYRTFLGSLKALLYNIEDADILYSASDFWPDSIPAFIAKLKNRDIKWVAAFYLFAPKPWRKDSPYAGKNSLIGIIYWLTQLPVYFIIKRYADVVFVTSEPGVDKFITPKKGRDKVIVIRGGVDIKPSLEYLNSKEVVPVNRRKYDAVFVGRFHYQKGILELIDIWKLVCEAKPTAKLATIGIGPLEDTVKRKIKKLRLENNIELLGFRDGDEKYEIFKQSKIVVHPAIYDSGGMAACEAMAWGLPGVSFDLEALKTYYPRGMVKTPCFDLKMFANNVIRLLEDKNLYIRTKGDAISWAREWDWEARADVIFNQMLERLA